MCTSENGLLKTGRRGSSKFSVQREEGERERGGGRGRKRDMQRGVKKSEGRDIEEGEPTIKLKNWTTPKDVAVLT